MNSFEVALLRILVKKRAPVKLGILVEGFPDENEDNVLAAISSLKLKGYLHLTEYHPDGLVSLIKDKQREAIKIVSMNIALPNDIAQTSQIKDDRALGYSSTHSLNKSERKLLQIRIPHRELILSTTARKLGITAVLIVSLFSIMAIGGLPALSNPNADPGITPIHYYYYHHNGQNHYYHQFEEYSNHDDGGGGADSMQASSYDDGHQPFISSFLVLKNCSQTMSS